MSDDTYRWMQPFGSVTVSRKLMEAQHNIDKAIAHALLHPPTPEQVAAMRSEREAEWDEKMAAGMVGISDHSDYGCAHEWREDERGDRVERWVTLAAWQRYLYASRLLSEAEESLDDGS